MRLRTYTIHLPEMAMRGDARALDRARIVPDGFCWAAFGFSVLWFVFHRLWLAAAIILLLLVALGLGGHILGLPPAAAVLATLLASGLIGLEASSLRRWTYGRRGLPARDAVIAASTDEAEAKAVARWLDPAATARPAGDQRLPGRRIDDSVIGFFPMSEAGR